MFADTKAFYKSKEWQLARYEAINKSTNSKGQIMCSHCNKPIISRYDCHVHHIIPITNANVNDYTISLNQDNLTCVHHKCHDDIHERFGHNLKRVTLVWGSPCSGKNRWVKENATVNDLVLDLDSIYQAISINDRYVKPNSISSMVFALRDEFYNQITMRNFTNNVYILSTEARVMPRERLIQRLGVDEVIHIDTSREECLSNLYRDESRVNCIKEYEGYINKFFDNLQV